jgi:hypothetical protein
MPRLTTTILAITTPVLMALATGAPALAGNLEPTDGPGPTMKTLDEIPPTWSQVIDLASERFELVMGGAAALDKETGLVWDRTPSDGFIGLPGEPGEPTLPPDGEWGDANDQCWNHTSGGRKGWRLASVEEFASLIDPAEEGSPTCALPAGHPFLLPGDFCDGGPMICSVSSPCGPNFWTSTQSPAEAGKAKYLSLINGYVGSSNVTYRRYVWCVRGSRGIDGSL